MRNWYKILKLAQIWDAEIEDGFDDYGNEAIVPYLEKLYELEYKLYIIQEMPFNGLPQRQENITNQLRKSLLEILHQVIEKLLRVYKGWLAQHALTDPEAWAESYLNDFELDYADGTGEIQNILDSLISRLVDDSGNVQTYRDPRQYGSIIHNTFLSILNNAINNRNQYPFLYEFLSSNFDGMKNIYYQDLNEEGFEEFGTRWGETFSSHDEAEQFIVDMELEDAEYYDVSEQFDSTEDFSAQVYNYGSWETIFNEMAKNDVFTAWYNKWSAEGIDETRKHIEDIYKWLSQVQNSGDIQEMIKITNIAIQAAHQTGPMLEHIAEQFQADFNIKETLDELSAGKNIPIWNEELKEIGVKLPSQLKLPINN